MVPLPPFLEGRPWAAATPPLAAFETSGRLILRCQLDVRGGVLHVEPDPHPALTPPESVRSGGLSLRWPRQWGEALLTARGGGLPLAGADRG
jgi:hypothetical protein